MEHELSHSRGIRHSTMRGSACGKVHDIGQRPNWAEGLTLRLKAPKAKPSWAQRAAKRAAKVDADLARWQRKLKLAKTKVKKLLAKQRYYQKLPHAGPDALHPLDQQPTLMAAKGPPTE